MRAGQRELDKSSLTPQDFAFLTLSNDNYASEWGETKGEARESKVESDAPSNYILRQITL